MRKARLPGLALAALALSGGAGLSASCDAGPPRRDCLARVWVPASAGAVSIAGSFTGWAPALGPAPYDDAWQLLRLALPPGEHGYLIVDEAGRATLDPLNPLTTFRAGDEEEVSLLLVPDCSVGRALAETASLDGGRAEVTGTYLAAASGAPLDPTSVTATSDDASLAVTSDPDTGAISAAGDLPTGRHAITVSAADEDGVLADPSRVVLFPGRRMETWADGVLYQVMIDRFRGDDGAYLAPPPTPGSRAGGTLDGVRAALEDGSLEALGVTALWLSPAYVVPDEPRLGRDGRMYEGYHGYWPVDSRGVDPRIGGADALHALVDAAHARGIAVILDVVPNHVDETNPLLDEHPGWYRPDACVCGAPDCDWGTESLSCLFVPYLPDVRLEDPGAMRNAVDETRFWVDEFGLDGVRLDAVPMIPRAALYRIAHGLRQVTPRDATFVLGEVFTGPGRDGLDQIAAFLGPSGLDSAFDFPLMWALHGAVARGDGGFAAVEDVLAHQESALRGAGVTLARMLDNHDVPRFVSVATGESAVDPWVAPPPQPTDDAPYDRMEVAFAVTFTLPGLPLVYYGDEVGLTGANDPDNRRVMPADGDLLPRQIALRDAVARLSALRRCSPALRRGSRSAVHVGQRTYGYLRGGRDEAQALVLISSEIEAAPIALETLNVADGPWVDARTGDAFDVVGGAVDVPMDALSWRVLLPASDPCLPPAP